MQSFLSLRADFLIAFLAAFNCDKSSKYWDWRLVMRDNVASEIQGFLAERGISGMR